MNQIQITIAEKIKKLETALSKMERVLVAFSGGKDSYFLLKTTISVLGPDQVKALFVDADFIAKYDKKRVEYLTQRMGIEVERLHVAVLENDALKFNPKDRCYICKSAIFSNIKERAKELNFNTVLDGTTYSDLDEYRPGVRALEELEIVSPLKDAGLLSSEIIDILSNEDLDPFYLTSSTCLATRFPYGTELSASLIRKFDHMESYLIDNGIFPLRVRYIKDGIRIEVPKEKIDAIVRISDELVNEGKQMGFLFVTLDLGGIKSGVWD